MPTTSWPASRSCRATLAAMKPAAPVRRYLLMGALVSRAPTYAMRSWCKKELRRADSSGVRLPLVFSSSMARVSMKCLACLGWGSSLPVMRVRHVAEGDHGLRTERGDQEGERGGWKLVVVGRDRCGDSALSPARVRRRAATGRWFRQRAGGRLARPMKVQLV